MKIEVRENVEITEAYPEVPMEGSVANRLIKYTGDGVPYYEFYQAEFYIYESGNAETGPIASLELGDWKQLGSGMGVTTLEEMIARSVETEGE